MININPWVILFQMINFCILVWLLNKFVVAPLASFLEKREKSIETNINEAERNKAESDALLNDQKAAIKTAYQEAKEIRQKAEEAAKTEADKAIAAAKEEAQQILANANKEIAANFVNAKNILKSQVGALAINLSEKLIKKNLNQADEKALIEEYINQARN